MQRLSGRLQRLEAAAWPTYHQRILHICRREGETTEAALARHGCEATPRDVIVVHRYGCAACRSPAHTGNAQDNPGKPASPSRAESRALFLQKVPFTPERIRHAGMQAAECD